MLKKSVCAIAYSRSREVNRFVLNEEGRECSEQNVSAQGTHKQLPHTAAYAIFFIHYCVIISQEYVPIRSFGREQKLWQVHRPPRSTTHSKYLSKRPFPAARVFTDSYFYIQMLLFPLKSDPYEIPPHWGLCAYLHGLLQMHMGEIFFPISIWSVQQNNIDHTLWHMRAIPITTLLSIPHSPTEMDIFFLTIHV